MTTRGGSTFRSYRGLLTYRQLVFDFPGQVPVGCQPAAPGDLRKSAIDGELVTHGLGAVVDPSSSAMRLKSRVPSSFSVLRNASRAERACVASRAWRPTMSWKSGILRRSRAAWSETALPVVVLLGLSVPAFERSEEERIRVTERRHPGRRG